MNDEPQRDPDAERPAPSANETGTPSEPAYTPQGERAREAARARERILRDPLLA